MDLEWMECLSSMSSPFVTFELHRYCTFWPPLLQRNNFNFEAVQEEWSGLKVCISNNFLDLNLKALWKRVFNNYSDRFCNILMLVEILLILPLSTACCERGVSLMGKIKSDWRSCLSVDILDCLIRITAEGPPVSDFDPLPALKILVEQWAKSKTSQF